MVWGAEQRAMGQGLEREESRLQGMHSELFLSQDKSGLLRGQKDGQELTNPSSA